MEDLNEEFQAEIVDENITYGNKEIPDNLRSTTQCGARKTDMTRHPETREEGNGELEHEGGDMRREGNETEVEDLAFEYEMIENIVQHPFQNEVQATTSRITEQLEAHHLAERRIEEVDDLGQSAFNPGFYVFQGWHSGRKNSNLEPNNIKLWRHVIPCKASAIGIYAFKAKQFVCFVNVIRKPQNIAATTWARDFYPEMKIIISGK